MNKQTKRILLSLYYIGAAVLLIVNELYGSMSFWWLLAIVLIAPEVLKFVFRGNFAWIFIPLAVLGIIFPESLGIEAITPWPLLGVAVLLTIAFSLIFRKNWNRSVRVNVSDETVESISDDNMSCTVKFGGTTKYFTSECFSRAYLNSKFGSIRAYFDGVKLSPDGAILSINASFSGIELYIPKNWKVTKSVSNTFGGIEEKGRNIADPNSPVLIITGDASFSGIVIHYI